MVARFDWATYAMLAILALWPVVAVIGLALFAAGSPWASFSVGYCAASLWGVGKTAVHFYRHGLDNHLCHRSCCRFDR